MPETFDKTVGSGGMPWSDTGKHFVLTSELIDCVAQALANGDVVLALKVPAKTFVSRVQIDVEVGEGAADTIDVGDGATADGFHDGVSVENAGSVMSALALTEAEPNTVTKYTNGKYYSAADTIDVTAKAAIVAAKFRIRAECVSFA